MDLNALTNLYRDPNHRAPPCYVVNVTASHGIWLADNPLTTTLPLLAGQLAVAIFCTRTLYYLLRPFLIPRIVADILGGILLGPTFLGHLPLISGLFPLRSVNMVETLAYFALSCHMFLVGLEMDVTLLFQIGKREIQLAAAGIIVPFTGGIGLFFFMNMGENDYDKAGCLVWGTALTATGYSIVARSLTDLKILHTDIGGMATQISLVTDLATWILLTVMLSLRLGLQNAIYASVSTTAFGIFCFYAVRPTLKFIIRHTTGGGNSLNEYFLCTVLAYVSVFGLMTEAFGVHSVVGAFIFGLIFPDRALAALIIEKFEDFISGYMLPLFFVICGIRINIWSVVRWGRLLFVLLASSSLKVVSTFIAHYNYNMTTTHCFALGVILNTKSLLSLLVLNTAFDKSCLSNQTYSTMVLSVIIMTAVVSPILFNMYRPAKRLTQYKGRTIQKGKQDNGLRILACLQDLRNVFGLINLIDSSNPTKQSPISVVALHLVELTGRASAMLIVHSFGKSGKRSKSNQSQQVVSVLESYANSTGLVTFQTITVLSPFSTMHEDICALAEDKQTAFLLLPFHRLPSQDGELEDEGSAPFRGVNLNTLANAPCTVGMFVDRGFGNVAEGQPNLTVRQVAMFFIGGHDDREALAYAWRMAGSRWVNLKVVRFFPGDEVEEIGSLDLPANDQFRLLTAPSYVNKQQRIDDEYMNEFRLKTAGEENISYEERTVNNDEELILAIKEIDQGFDLYVVGKGDGIVSPLTKVLLDWCEYQELGAIGDLLVTASFAKGSVLVIRQYTESRDASDVPSTASASQDCSLSRRHGFGSWHCQAEDDHGNEVDLEMEPLSWRREDGIVNH